MNNFKQSLKTETTTYRTIKIFNTELEFESYSKAKKLNTNQVIDLINDYVVEFQYESFRKDNKTVLLFYTASEISSNHVKFLFAVEEDEVLKKLAQYGTKHKRAMIEYLVKNHNNLNFDI